VLHDTRVSGTTAAVTDVRGWPSWSRPPTNSKARPAARRRFDGGHCQRYAARLPPRPQAATPAAVSRRLSTLPSGSRWDRRRRAAPPPPPGGVADRAAPPLFFFVSCCRGFGAPPPTPAGARHRRGVNAATAQGHGRRAGRCRRLTRRRRRPRHRRSLRRVDAAPLDERERRGGGVCPSARRPRSTGVGGGVRHRAGPRRVPVRPEFHPWGGRRRRSAPACRLDRPPRLPRGRLRRRG